VLRWGTFIGLRGAAPRRRLAEPIWAYQEALRCARIAPCKPGFLQVPNLLPRPRLRSPRPGVLPVAHGNGAEAGEPDIISSGGVRWLNLERPREADRDWLEREFGFHPLAI
jgi:Mg2+ and Co2+ transporter CorA